MSDPSVLHGVTTRERSGTGKPPWKQMFHHAMRPLNKSTLHRQSSPRSAIAYMAFPPSRSLAVGSSSSATVELLPSTLPECTTWRSPTDSTPGEGHLYDSEVVSPYRSSSGAGEDACRQVAVPSCAQA
ncbi:unnamed protein product [Euphydryas editha]|uniref:Uncharacterized protein n=1 Tax=Euphydryas editha TaxID=104508 RepID=A0AAU9V5N8_EUPED|nr:unnamed protein product [Euphydryas editha]